MAAMPPCVAAHASCMKRPRWRTTFKPSSKLIAPAAVSAVNSPSDKPAVAWKLRAGTRSLSSSKAAQLTRKIPGCACSVFVSSGSGPLKQIEARS